MLHSMLKVSSYECAKNLKINAKNAINANVLEHLCIIALYMINGIYTDEVICQHIIKFLKANDNWKQLSSNCNSKAVL